MASPRSSRKTQSKGGAAAGRTQPAFRRVLLKLSGEALLGAKTFGIDEGAAPASGGAY